MSLTRGELISPDCAWNWKPCGACRGKGKLNLLYDGYGRAISEDICPTCRGEGGWPLIADVDVNARMKQARAGLKPLRI